MPETSWFRRRPRYSLRAIIALVLIANVAWAAWFQWAWSVTVHDWTDHKTERPSDLQCLAAAVSYPTWEIPVFRGLGMYSFESLNSKRLADDVFSLDLPLWARQVSSVRYDLQVGRECHGPTTLYYPGGEVCAREFWRDGRLHGEYVAFYPDGRPLVEGRYVDGQKHGVWRVRRTNGEVFARMEFDGGRPTGQWQQRQRAEDYAKIEYHVEQVTADITWTFTERGNIQRIEEERRGPDGLRRITREYEAGQRHGRQENRDELDRLRFEAHWEHGQPHGHWASYDADGACRLEAQFVHGKLVSVNGESISEPIPAAPPEDESEFFLTAEPKSWYRILELAENATVFLRQAARESPPFSDVVSLEWEGNRASSLPVLRQAAGITAVRRHGAWFYEAEPYTPPADQAAEIARLKALAKTPFGLSRWDGLHVIPSSVAEAAVAPKRSQ